MNKKYRYPYFIYFLIVFVHSTIFGQVNSFRNINSNGLVDFQVNCFCKDSKGFIWTGGTFMVQRFDGKNIKAFKLPTQVKKVNDIQESKDGILYIATTNGVYKLTKQDPIIQSTFKDSQTNINALYIDRKNKFYLGTNTGLITIDNGKTNQIDISTTDFPFNQILDIKPSGNNTLWFLTPGGVISYNTSSQISTCIPILNYTNSSYCTSFEQVDSCLYVGTKESGLFCIDTKSFKVKPFMNIGNGNITSIAAADNSTDLYVGTAGTGVFHISILDEKIKRTFNSSQNNTARLSSSMITNVMVDNFGILWVGTAEHLGFDYMFVNPKPFSIYSSVNFTTKNLTVNQFYLGKDFKLLVGLHKVFYMPDKTDKVWQLEAGIGNAIDLKPGKINTIHPYKNLILLGGENGIYAFDKKTLSIYIFEPTSHVLQGSTINHITTDKKNNLWIASSRGIYILDAQSNILKEYNSSNSSLRNDSIQYIYFDVKNRTWICTEDGVSIWNTNQEDITIRHFSESQLSRSRVHHILEDHSGRFIFCYDVKKVMLSNSDLTDFKRICTEESAGFTGLRILKTLQDKDGGFWFIGSRGAIRSNDSFNQYDQFSISEGLLEPYATDGHFDKNGCLWLSNHEGLYYATGNFNRLDAQMAITDFKVNGESKVYQYQQELEKQEEIVLSKEQNNIEFQFALLDYTRSDLMVYEYKLLKNDSSWHILRDINHVRFKNLKPGSYTFVVRHNMDKNTTQKVDFMIKPLLSGIQIIWISAIVFILSLFTYLRFKRKIVKTKHVSEAKDNKSMPDEDEKYKFNKISQNEANAIISNLQECMQEKQMYLNDDLKISDLAQAIGCSNQTLSQVFNRFLNQKYYDYINHYRIEEFKRLVSQNDQSKYTIRTLAQMSGFLSYTSFYRAFKNNMGITPNEFIKDKLSN